MNAEEPYKVVHARGCMCRVYTGTFSIDANTNGNNSYYYINLCTMPHQITLNTWFYCDLTIVDVDSDIDTNIES